MLNLRYCVIKDTTKIIDGSANSLEIMLQNAQNTGFSESEVEILTEEEYMERVELEPKPVPPPSVKERLAVAEETINIILGL